MKGLEPIQMKIMKFNPQSPYAISKLYSHLVTINYRESIIYLLAVNSI